MRKRTTTKQFHAKRKRKKAFLPCTASPPLRMLAAFQQQPIAAPITFLLCALLLAVVISQLAVAVARSDTVDDASQQQTSSIQSLGDIATAAATTTYNHTGARTPGFMLPTSDVEYEAPASPYEVYDVGTDAGDRVHTGVQMSRRRKRSTIILDEVIGKGSLVLFRLIFYSLRRWKPFRKFVDIDLWKSAQTCFPVLRGDTKFIGGCQAVMKDSFSVDPMAQFFRKTFHSLDAHLPNEARRQKVAVEVVALVTKMVNEGKEKRKWKNQWNKGQDETTAVAPATEKKGFFSEMTKAGKATWKTLNWVGKNAVAPVVDNLAISYCEELKESLEYFFANGADHMDVANKLPACDGKAVVTEYSAGPIPETYPTTTSSQPPPPPPTPPPPPPKPLGEDPPEIREKDPPPQHQQQQQPQNVAVEGEGRGVRIARKPVPGPFPQNPLAFAEIRPQLPNYQPDTISSPASPEGRPAQLLQQQQSAGGMNDAKIPLIPPQMGRTARPAVRPKPDDPWEKTGTWPLQQQESTQAPMSPYGLRQRRGSGAIGYSHNPELSHHSYLPTPTAATDWNTWGEQLGGQLGGVGGRRPRRRRRRSAWPASEEECVKKEAGQLEAGSVVGVAEPNFYYPEATPPLVEDEKLIPSITATTTAVVPLNYYYNSTSTSFFASPKDGSEQLSRVKRMTVAAELGVAASVMMSLTFAIILNKFERAFTEVDDVGTVVNWLGCLRSYGTRLVRLRPSSRKRRARYCGLALKPLRENEVLRQLGAILNVYIRNYDEDAGKGEREMLEKAMMEIAGHFGFVSGTRAMRWREIHNVVELFQLLGIQLPQWLLDKSIKSDLNPTTTNDESPRAVSAFDKEMGEALGRDFAEVLSMHRCGSRSEGSGGTHIFPPRWPREEEEYGAEVERSSADRHLCSFANHGEWVRHCLRDDRRTERWMRVDSLTNLHYSRVGDKQFRRDLKAYLDGANSSGVGRQSSGGGGGGMGLWEADFCRYPTPYWRVHNVVLIPRVFRVADILSPRTSQSPRRSEAAFYWVNKPPPPSPLSPQSPRASVQQSPKGTTRYSYPNSISPLTPVGEAMITSEETELADAQVRVEQELGEEAVDERKRLKIHLDLDFFKRVAEALTQLWDTSEGGLGAGMNQGEMPVLESPVMPNAELNSDDGLHYPPEIDEKFESSEKPKATIELDQDVFDLLQRMALRASLRYKIQLFFVPTSPKVEAHPARVDNQIELSPNNRPIRIRGSTPPPPASPALPVGEAGGKEPPTLSISFQHERVSIDPLKGHATDHFLVKEVRRKRTPLRVLGLGSFFRKPLDYGYVGLPEVARALVCYEVKEALRLLLEYFTTEWQARRDDEKNADAGKGTGNKGWASTEQYKQLQAASKSILLGLAQIKATLGRLFPHIGFPPYREAKAEHILAELYSDDLDVDHLRENIRLPEPTKEEVKEVKEKMFGHLGFQRRRALPFRKIGRARP